MNHPDRLAADKPMNPIVKTYSPQEVADLLGLSKATILGAVKTGELPAIRYNARVFRVAAVDCAAWYALRGGRLRSTTSTTPITPPAA